MPLKIIQKDITKIKVDGIVNAANTNLKMGGGVCGAIFSAAGADKLQEDCDKLAPIKTGEALITKGYNLPAKYIIHTAGPIFDENNKEKSEKLLRASYKNSLELALEHNLESLAFPLISSGIYGYPKKEAYKVATSEIKEFLKDNDLTVYLIIFDKSVITIEPKTEKEIEKYIENLKEVSLFEKRRLRKEYRYEMKDSEPTMDYMRIESMPDEISHLEESFSEALFEIIDSKNLSDPEVYKGANIDRKLFSKIRNKGYQPSKKSAIALAISLKLDLEETSELLEKAGYALSKSLLFDNIIRYYIEKGNYDIFEINEHLFKETDKTLGI